MYHAVSASVWFGDGGGGGLGGSCKQTLCCCVSSSSLPFFQHRSHSQLLMRLTRLQIRGELVTQGYHVLWFALVQTASGQRASNTPWTARAENLSPPTFNVLLKYLLSHTALQYLRTFCRHVSLLSISHLLSALLDLIPKESNFALTQNSRSKRQSLGFMAFLGIQRTVQCKPLKGISSVRKEGD